MNERWSFGADIGGTWIRLGLVRSGPPAEAVATVRRPWQTGADPLRTLADTLADELIEMASQRGVDPIGTPLGIGLAAQLSPDGRTVLNAPNIGWRNVALAEALEARLGRPAGSLRIVNDLHAIVRGELAGGAAVGVQHAVALYAGTGVGGAAVVNGRLVRGAGGTAGELGHIKLTGVTAPCGCGETGCLEAIAGGAALSRRVAALRFDGSDQTGDDPGDLARLQRAAAAGHPGAMALVEEVADALATVASGLCTFLNPQVLLLGGGVLGRVPLLRARFEVLTLARTLAVARTRLEVRDGTLGDLAGIIGAAAAAGEHP